MIIVPIKPNSNPAMTRETTDLNSNNLTTDPINGAQLRAELRTELLTRRQALSDAQCATRDAQLVHELHTWLSANVAATACIALYYPFKNEPNLMPLADAWCAQGGTVLLPIVRTKNAPLVFAPYTGADALCVGAFGILEPQHTEHSVRTSPEGIDVVVLPCVGFSMQGYRLGYGGGYYDRTCGDWLARGYELPKLIGVADKDSQIELRSEAHDVVMDGFICA